MSCEYHLEIITPSGFKWDPGSEQLPFSWIWNPWNPVLSPSMPLTLIERLLDASACLNVMCPLISAGKKIYSFHREYKTFLYKSQEKYKYFWNDCFYILIYKLSTFHTIHGPELTGCCCRLVTMYHKDGNKNNASQFS